MPRAALLLGALALGVMALCALRLWMGGGGTDAEQTRQLLEIRGIRTLTGTLVGLALGVAGVLLQSLLRNPLASPDLLGLSSGAGLGVMVAVFAGYLAGAGLADPGGLGATGAAVAGACATLALVYAISQRGGFVDPATLVLVGVIVGVIASGCITLVQHLLPDQGVAARRLLLGALRDDVRAGHVLGVGGLTLACVAGSLAIARWMDASSLSEDEAQSVGVPLTALRTVQFIIAGVLTACSVVLAGPIGFIGFLAPHAARGLLGPHHRTLLLGAGLIGAGLVVGADVLVALVRELAPSMGRLPLGVVTAALGGPVFLLMLRRGWSAGSRAAWKQAG